MLVDAKSASSLPLKMFQQNPINILQLQSETSVLSLPSRKLEKGFNGIAIRSPSINNNFYTILYYHKKTASFISTMIFQRQHSKYNFSTPPRFIQRPPNNPIFTQDIPIIEMKSTGIQSQLKDYKIREGYLLKRSRVLREWRKRWMVLTFNYLFSFENETCAKLTQTIDLRQVVSLKSGLKNSEESYPNCLYVQTKSTDFVFSTGDAEEKWSWMVTLQRLFDLKEKGASMYNNIDMIRSQGFESQNEYQYKQKIKVKSRSSRTISVAEEQRRKELLADELLQSLRLKQQEIEKKQQMLNKEGRYLEKQKKSSSDFSVQIGQLNSQLGRLQQQNAFLREELRSIYNRKLAEQINSEENYCLTRTKSIEYLLRWFDGRQNEPELSLIIQFLLKLNEIQSYGEIISKVTHNYKHLSYFMKTFLSNTQNLITKEQQNVIMMFAFMRRVFRDQYLLEVSYFVEAQRIVLERSENFNKETPLSLLEDTVSLLFMLFFKSNELKQKTIDAITYLSSLGEEETYRSRCEQTLIKIAETNQQLQI